MKKEIINQLFSDLDHMQSPLDGSIEMKKKMSNELYKNSLPQVIELAEYYAKSDSKERKSIRDNCTQRAGFTLINYSVKLAEMKNKRMLFLALITHSIEDFHDWRENGDALLTINAEIKNIGEDPAELYEKVIGLSSKYAAEQLKGHCEAGFGLTPEGS